MMRYLSVLSMFSCLYLSVLTCSYSYAAKAVYKQTLPNGQVIYSNTAQPGAQPVKLQPSPVNLQSTAPVASPMNMTVPDPALEKSPDNYQIAFITPINEQVYTIDQTDVNISLNISPALSSKDHVQLLIDNIPYGGLESTSQYTVSHLDRGAHNLQAKIYSEKNTSQIKGQTGIIRIHVQRGMIRK